MNIVSVELGLVNDDFLYDRETIRVAYSENSFNTFKKYSNGEIKGYFDERFTGGEYEEYELDPKTKHEIMLHVEHLNANQVTPSAKSVFFAARQDELI